MVMGGNTDNRKNRKRVEKALCAAGRYGAERGKPNTKPKDRK